MLSRIRKHVTYTNAALTLALVFAMSGGAYATGKYLITSTKQISPKVLKALVGKRGPAGPTGLSGSGVQGAIGPQGKEGSQGKEGMQGKEGVQGKEGPQGKQGASGTTGFTETLPSGKTETGTWSYSAFGAGAVVSAISFPIPLAVALNEAHVNYIGGAPTAACPGSIAQPSAEPGNLCVYQMIASGVKNTGGIAEAEIFPPSTFPKVLNPSDEAGAGTTGAEILFIAEGSGIGWGSWAVTEK